jgi:NTE family protein
MPAASNRNRPLKVGLALGSGSGRGWTHIGVLRALQERGIEPVVISGASSGSLVAAAYASRQLDQLEQWARSLTKVDVWRLLDATFRGGGVMRGNRLFRAVGDRIEDRPIESLDCEFGAVAADLYSGREIWIRTGSMLEAVRASSGMPGLFTPLYLDERWLIDGGVVNPVPVSLCRAMGADFVIAVNLNRPASRLESHSSQSPPEARPEESPENSTEAAEGRELLARWSGLLENLVSSVRRDSGPSASVPSEPGMLEVMYTTITIMQDQITRSRLVGDPPDLILRPQLSDFQMMDFHRAAEAIDIGYDAMERMAAELPEHG